MAVLDAPATVSLLDFNRIGVIVFLDAHFSFTPKVERRYPARIHLRVRIFRRYTKNQSSSARADFVAANVFDKFVNAGSRNV